MQKHDFHDYDNLQLLSEYSYVVIFGLKSLSFLLLQPLFKILDHKYDYR